MGSEEKNGLIELGPEPTASEQNEAKKLFALCSPPTPLISTAKGKPCQKPRYFRNTPTKAVPDVVLRLNVRPDCVFALQSPSKQGSTATNQAPKDTEYKEPTGIKVILLGDSAVGKSK
jgi:hypothetical protein